MTQFSRSGTRQAFKALGPRPWVPSIILYHKPKGQIVTRQDERQRHTVYRSLPRFVWTAGWMPVGRLDRLSRGLLLFTQAGHLIDSLTQPGRCEKSYNLVIRGRLSDRMLAAACEGIPSPFGLIKAQHIEKMREIGPKTFLRAVLTEGRNRHLRRLFHAFLDPQYQTPLKVVDLKRTRIGPLELGDLPAGHWRFITQIEETELFRTINFPAGPKLRY